MLSKEIPAQVGVFSVTLLPGANLKPGDIVSVLRDGSKLGEATVLRLDASGNAYISLKGVFDAQPGDRVDFARSAAVPAPAPSPSATTAASSGKLVYTHTKNCPKCGGLLKFVRARPDLRKTFNPDLYVCPKGHQFWASQIDHIEIKP